MVLYEIAHFIPSVVVNCDIIILWVLLSILVFIYRQIIILPKYNLCFVLLCHVHVSILCIIQAGDRPKLEKRV